MATAALAISCLSLGLTMGICVLVHWAVRAVIAPLATPARRAATEHATETRGAVYRPREGDM